MKPDRIGYRPTWAQIDLRNLRNNFLRIRKLLGKSKIIACVKADAYGHGIRQVAGCLVAAGVDHLGVASIDEGIVLRRAGIRVPILILGVTLKEHSEPLFRYSLTPTVCTWESAYALHARAKAKRKPLNVHIKVDTGMGRIGVLYPQAAALIRKVHALPFVRIEGVFTHLASADVDPHFTSQQVALFGGLIRELTQEGITVPLVHAANSMGVIAYRKSHFNTARPGLILYGLHPRSGISLRVEPVLSLQTRIVYVKRVDKGFGVSYGRTYTTARKTTIVTLPVGYGDGYPRNLSNTGPVLIHGKRFSISGRVCMDQIMVDVGNEKVAVGDEAVLIGSQGKERISAEELAARASTIPYEIVCGLGSRIPRIYLAK